MAQKKWYREGLCFECTQCGNCCSGEPGYVWATKEEIHGIAEHLGRDDGWLDKAQLRRVGFRYSLTEKPNGDCVFLVREAGRVMCSIYPVRPLQCRTWPFWSGVVRTAGSWAETARKCPGMNEGKHYDFEQIESIRTQKEW